MVKKAASRIYPLLLLALSMTTSMARADEGGPNARAAWFVDARFGMFITWNASSVDSRYCGEPVRQGNYGEWLRARNRMPRADWDAATRQMSITPERVDGWAEAARQAGMKYIIFVAKFHDGLALWPSKVSDYTFNNVTGNSFDIVGRLKQACDQRGLKLMFYYSQWQDWEDPNGWGNFWEFNKDPKQFDLRDNFYALDGGLFRDDLKPEQFDKYWRNKSMAQVAELITRYHPAGIWFDCYLPQGQTIMTDKQLHDMLAMIRKLDPDCMVNSRLPITKIGGDEGADFETLGDNEFPHKRIGHPWESAVTFALSWGYNRDDQTWRPATYFIRNLVRNVSLGGNMVINVGPLADGSIPREAMVRLEEIGTCLKANREGIHGCGYTPYLERVQDWGLTTTNIEPGTANALYLHIFDWPVDGIIRVNGLKTQVRAATLCSADRQLEFDQQGNSTHVNAHGIKPLAYDTVIRPDLGGELAVDNDLIGERNGGEIVMQAAQANLTGVKAEEPPGWSTKLPKQLAGWTAPDASASWKITVPAAGKYRVRICYAATTAVAGQEYIVSAGSGMEIRGSTEGTHRNWSEFRPFESGSITFPKAGAYTVTVRPAGPVKGELFKLLWLCVSPATNH